MLLIITTIQTGNNTQGNQRWEGCFKDDSRLAKHMLSGTMWMSMSQRIKGSYQFTSLSCCLPSGSNDSYFCSLGSWRRV